MWRLLGVTLHFREDAVQDAVFASLERLAGRWREGVIIASDAISRWSPSSTTTGQGARLRKPPGLRTTADVDRPFDDQTEDPSEKGPKQHAEQH